MLFTNLINIFIIAFIIFNDVTNPYILQYVVSWILSNIIVHLSSNKFTLDKQINYCNFADTRCKCKIRNFGDVISNVAFFIPSIYHIFYTCNVQLSTICFCITIGSTYFHWTPNLSTLYWDRLPMIFGMVYIQNYHTSINFTNLLLYGLFTLEYHKITNDLSFYVVYQLNMLILLVMVQGFTIKLVLYIMAKFFEDYDREIFKITGEYISGHTIKHILAGVAMMFI